MKNVNKKNVVKNNIPSKKDFWFLPLGGSGEIGMNLNLYGHDGAWLMVDCGVTFNNSFLGIDVITPDPTFIAQNQKLLKGLVLTHAHEDHIGAIPYLWTLLKCPIYATPFTAGVVRKKISEYEWADEVKIIEVSLGGKVKIEPFSIEFVTLTHSIPEPNALAIKTDLGTVIHTGDWKIDDSPMVGKTTDKNRLKELGDQGVIAMVCDSTNVFSHGYTGSEADVRKELSDLIAKYPDKRITVCCFASNIARLESIALAAQNSQRKVCLVGRSLDVMTNVAKNSGYLKTLSNFIAVETAVKMSPDKVLFISTGSQGEPRAALSRIATQQHPDVKFDDRDVVFFSSRVIPGNEKSISMLQNRLAKIGVKVITSQEEDIHVSGHPTRDDLKIMYDLVRPKVLIPVHGELRHIKEQEEFALSCGIESALSPYNGSLISLSSKGASIIGEVSSGRWGLDGKRMIAMDSIILKERHKISIEGIITISLVLKNGAVNENTIAIEDVGLLEKNSRSDEFYSTLRKKIASFAKYEFDNKDELREEVVTSVKQLVKNKFGKKPKIIVHVLEV
jgi:ribonuclease J